MASDDNGMISIRRATLIWCLGAVAQFFVVVYGYGQVTAQVQNDQQRLNKMEQRIDWLYEHAGGK